MTAHKFYLSITFRLISSGRFFSGTNSGQGYEKKLNPRSDLSADHLLDVACARAVAALSHKRLRAIGREGLATGAGRWPPTSRSRAVHYGMARSPRYSLVAGRPATEPALTPGERSCVEPPPRPCLGRGATVTRSPILW